MAMRYACGDEDIISSPVADYDKFWSQMKESSLDENASLARNAATARTPAGKRPHPFRSPRVSGSWLSLLMTENPSDEQEAESIEAASVSGLPHQPPASRSRSEVAPEFERFLGLHTAMSEVEKIKSGWKQQHTPRNRKKKGGNHQGDDSDVTKVYRNDKIAKKKVATSGSSSSDSSTHHDQRDEEDTQYHRDQETVGGYFGGGRKAINFFDSLQTGMCSYDSIDNDKNSRKIIPDSGVVKQYQHSLWKMLDPRSEDEMDPDGATSQWSDESFSVPNSSYSSQNTFVTPTDFDDIFADLRDEIPILRERSEAKSLGSSKYQSILRNRSIKSSDGPVSSNEEMRPTCNHHHSILKSKSNHTLDNNKKSAMASQTKEWDVIQCLSRVDLEQANCNSQKRAIAVSPRAPSGSAIVNTTVQEMESPNKKLSSYDARFVDDAVLQEGAETKTNDTDDAENRQAPDGSNIERHQQQQQQEKGDDAEKPLRRKEKDFPRTVEAQSTGTGPIINDMSTLTAEKLFRRKEKDLPRTVEVEEVQSTGTGPIINDVSTLTEESAKRGRATRIIDIPNGGFSKSCMPSMFQKRLGLRRMLQTDSKPEKSLSTSSNSVMFGVNYPVSRTIHTSASDGSGDKGKITYEYEYDSMSHAYIAYFRRGEPSRHSIRLYEHPSPPVFPTLASEVVVKVEASTVSKSDCAVRLGVWWGEGSRTPLNLPIVPGVAFAGRVVQLDRAGSRSGLRQGDLVTSLVRVGANSRHLCIASDRLVKVPPEIRDSSVVACLPEIYLSAFQVLHLGQKNAARYRRTSLTGRSILILGGATCLGRALIELALAAGAGTVYATGKDKQFPLIEEPGGFPLSKDLQNWFSLVEGKMDLVIGAEKVNYAKSELKYEHIQTLNNNGRLVLIGGPDQEEPSVVQLETIDERSIGTDRQLHHYNVFDSWESDMKQAKRDLSHLMKLAQDDELKPKILDWVPLSKVAKAQDLVERKRLHGFVICEPWIKRTKRDDKDTTAIDIYTESASRCSVSQENDEQKDHAEHISLKSPRSKPEPAAL